MTRTHGTHGTNGIGIALAGGGPAGLVYEIGALHALEEAIDGLDLTRADSLVGVSAGSLVAACLANGMTPAQLARILVNAEPGEAHFDPEHFFTPAYGEWLRRTLRVPRLVSQALWRSVTRPRTASIVQSLTDLSQALPVALFDNEPIRRYVARMFAVKGRSDDFRDLAASLTVVAADLDTAEPVRFGAPVLDHVPISRAIQASSAVPLVYPAVPVEGRRCVDGALLKTAHASVALEQGVELLLVVNPIVPIDTRPAVRSGGMSDDILIQQGIPAVLSQTVRTMLHSRMRTGLAAYARRFPKADVLLVEPRRDEYRMFFSNMFSFSSRQTLCELAYDVTRRDLLRRSRQIAPMLRRHGLKLRLDVLQERRRDFWRGVGVRSRESGRRASERLERTIARLESVLMEDAPPLLEAGAGGSRPRRVAGER